MIEDSEYMAFLEVIHKKYGYDFREYAESSVKRRIQYYMDKHSIGTIHDLVECLLSDDHVFQEFVQELSITVTEMFRDPSFFRQLRNIIIPRLATYPFIKIWVAGCATGQEVYSLSIILREEGLSERTIIYATDINQKSIHVAQQGLFHIAAMQRYTANYQQAGGKYSFSDYYVSTYGSVLFDKSLRDNVVFAAHNLAIDGAFNEFQLIICRNVIMYFNQTLQNKVFDLFSESLCPFGILGLGDKESLLFYKRNGVFEELDGKEKIYIKKK
jgi:chemotaxis protein methyltransferase CheR